MKKDYWADKESHELKSIMHEQQSKKHFNDIRSMMSEDDLKQVFKLKCSEGTPEELNNWIVQSKPNDFNLTQGLLFACVNGNLSVVKYFIETPGISDKVNLYVPYQAVPPHYVSDGVLLHSHFNGQSDIVDYLLYNVKFEVCRDTINYLKFHQINDLLNKIEKRELFFNLEKEMSNPEEKEKTPKLKI